MDGMAMIRRHRAPWLAMAAAALLPSACAKPVRPPVRPAAVPPVLLIPVPAPAGPVVRKPADPPIRCPSAADMRRLRAARPRPLRTQPMPASPAERVARTAAQLGLYEARGAWADQVDETLGRCAPD